MICIKEQVEVYYSTNLFRTSHKGILATAQCTERLTGRERDETRALLSGPFFSMQKQRSVDNERQWGICGLRFGFSPQTHSIRVRGKSTPPACYLLSVPAARPCWRTRKPRWKSHSWSLLWASHPCLQLWWPIIGQCWAPEWKNLTPPVRQPTSDFGGSARRASSLWRKTLRAKAVAPSAYLEVRESM